MDFPIFKTKIEGLNQRFDLNNRAERKKYFELKAGLEIKKLREYLKKNSFIAYLLGKKNSGKGTYAKMFMEIIDNQNVVHLSVGDLVRAVDKGYQDRQKREELIGFLKNNYRGFVPIEELLEFLETRSTKNLLPTEFILALIKREINKLKGKALFIDGFPRDLDQVSYSLFFRDLIDYRDDPDVFVIVDLPEAIINERIKYRVVCPTCLTPRNLKLLPTKEVGYNKEAGQFFLICDNPTCQKAVLVTKEGDELGIEPIRKRLKKDEIVINRALALYGVPKIMLRNTVPVDLASQYVDDYEITLEYNYVWNQKEQRVEIHKKMWTVSDDHGVFSYSLLPPPVVLALIKQLTKVLSL